MCVRAHPWSINVRDKYYMHVRTIYSSGSWWERIDDSLASIDRAAATANVDSTHGCIDKMLRIWDGGGPTTRHTVATYMVVSMEPTDRHLSLSSFWCFHYWTRRPVGIRLIDGGRTSETDIWNVASSWTDRQTNAIALDRSDLDLSTLLCMICANFVPLELHFSFLNILAIVILSGHAAYFSK